MKVLTVNVKGLSLKKVGSVLADLSRLKVSLAVLTESHLTKARCSKLESRYPRVSILTAGGSENSRGVTVLILDTHKVPPEKAVVRYCDTDGRYLAVELLVYDQVVRLLGVYSPNKYKEQQKFFRMLRTLILAFKPTMVLGDFNFCEDPRDVNPPRRPRKDLRSQFVRGLEGGGLVDGWRTANREAIEYTFWGSGHLRPRSRLDRIYVRHLDISHTSDWEIGLKPFWSDHAPVSFIWSRELPVDRGPGQWYFNTNLLGNERLHSVVTTFLEERVSETMDPWKRTRSECLKLRSGATDSDAMHRVLKLLKDLRSILMTLQKEIALGLNRKIRRFQRRIVHLSKQVTRHTPGRRRNAARLCSVQAKLDKLQELRGYRRTLHAKNRLHTEGFGNTRNFWQQGTPHTTTTVAALQSKPNPAGCTRIYKKSRKILKVAKAFYKNLYRRERTEKNSRNWLLSLLPREKMRGIKGPVTFDELSEVIRHWPNHTVPGPSGIPYELWKSFRSTRSGPWTLQHVLQALCTLVIGRQTYQSPIPKELLEGRIKVMYKKGDPKLIENYRPLCMTETLYKLATSVIARRLEKPFQKLIGTHQAGFLPGRQITEQIKTAQCLIDVARQRNTPLYLVFLDQVKAYDRVSHSWLRRCLRRVGVPRPLVCSIMEIYHGSASRLMINGHLSSPIPLSRGVRQGDPLSCLLFDLTIEPFALALIHEQKMGGFTLSDKRVIKTLMYADDTMIVLNNLDREWTLLLKIYKRYGKASGAQNNWSKSTVLAIIDAAKDTYQPLRELTVQENAEVSYLGIPVGVNVDHDAFWTKCLEKVRNRIRHWDTIMTSRWARVAVTKTMYQSLAWYALRTLPVSRDVLTNLQQLCDRYIWNTAAGNRCSPSIPLSQTRRKPDEGGLGVLDVKTMKQALTLHWIRRLEELANTPSPLRPMWYPLMMELFLHKVPETYKLATKRPWAQSTNLHQQTYPPSIQHFWKDWALHRQNPQLPQTTEDLLATNFWLHPSLPKGGRGTVKWGAPCWRVLLEGEFPGAPILSVNQLIGVVTGKYPVPKSTVQAAQRLLSAFPPTWSRLLPSAMAEETAAMKEAGLYSRLTDTHVPVTGTNKQRYDHLLGDTLRQPKCHEDLLLPLKRVCQRDGITLSFTDKQVWNSLKWVGVDYPKFADLYWQLVHNAVRTGEDWMPHSGFCPRCNVPQVAEHMLFHCPIAKTAWSVTRKVYFGRTGIKRRPYQKWAEVLTDGFGYRDGDKGDLQFRLWRVLYGITIYQIWRERCKFSFGEVASYSRAHILRSLRQEILARYHQDRLLALEYPSSKHAQAGIQTWNVPGVAKSYADLLSRPAMDLGGKHRPESPNPLSNGC